MAVRGLPSHLDLNVPDAPASVEFYSLLLGHLGYVRRDVGADRAEFSIGIPGGGVFGIEIRPPAASGGDVHDRYAPGIDHLAFHVESSGAVDVVFELVRSAGYEVADPPAEYDYTPGYYAVAFDDPSGIRLEVVHDPSTNPA